MSSPTFWKDKRVLVTGGHGFLGRHLLTALGLLGADVHAPPKEKLDLLQEPALARVLGTNVYDLVIHLAAVIGGIGRNAIDPGRIFRDNMLMGMNVIHCAHLYGVPKVVCLGSICAYPKFCDIPFQECDLWNGYPEETNAPYGFAKKMLTVMSDAYRKQYGLNSIVIYPSNLYGPYDHFDLETCHVIPAMIRKFTEARNARAASVTLWGDGSATREFLYAPDCVEGILLAAEHYDSSEPLNLGTGAEISIAELAELIRRMTGYEGSVVYDTTRPNGQPRRRVDATRAQRLIGFSPATSLADGLSRTVDWYLSSVERSRL